MAFKHQSNCYRNIKGVKYENHADLIYGEVENQEVIEKAKKEYKNVKKIKHHSGAYYQLFVASPLS